jgi:hypothetical protein
MSYLIKTNTALCTECHTTKQYSLFSNSAIIAQFRINHRVLVCACATLHHIDILQVPGNAAPDLLAHAPPSALFDAIWRNMMLDALVCYQI